LKGQPPDRPQEKLPSILKAKPLPAAAGDDELRNLLKARYNEALAEVQGRYEGLAVTPAPLASVFEPAQRLRAAGLEVSDRPADQIALLTQVLDLARLLERRAEAEFKSGQGAPIDLHRARYFRLDTEIQLLRAKGKANAVPPR
jgi:hypothetical protein